MLFKSRLKAKREGTDSVSDEALDLESRKAHLQIQSDRIATEGAIITAKEELANALSTIPYSPGNIIRAKSKLAGLEKGLHDLIALENEEFSSVVKPPRK